MYGWYMILLLYLNMAHEFCTGAIMQQNLMRDFCGGEGKLV